MPNYIKFLSLLALFISNNVLATPDLSSVGPQSLSTNSAVIRGNLVSYSGADLPEVSFLFDNEGNFSTARFDPYFPYQFTNLDQFGLWLDANDSSTITDNSGAVSEWKDKSGNQLHVTQSTAAKQPTTNSTTQNGKNVISFDGGDYLVCSSTNIQNTDQVWFFVAEIDSGGVDHAADGIFTYGAWGTGQWHLRANNGSQFRGKLNKDGNSLGTSDFSTSHLNGYQIYSLIFDRTNSKYSSRLNGVINDSDVIDTENLKTNKLIRVFTASNESYSPVGKIAEIICLKDISLLNTEKIEGYLAHKWGLSGSLASTHPHKIIPPSGNTALTKLDLGTISAGTFDANLTGLEMGKVYKYRFFAKNTGGYKITDYFSFETVGLPNLSLLYPLNVTPSSATLQANVISNGQENPSLTFYWGDENSSNQAAGWDNFYSLSGSHGVGIHSHSISSLISGTTYYFTVKAVNSAGTTWSEVGTFIANNNSPPSQIVSNAPLEMNETLPIGSTIASFSATDPDQNATISFALVDINATTQNYLFQLNPSGVLSNLVEFDFENNSSNYLIRVRATDEFSAYREEEFLITLLNKNEAPSLISHSGIGSVQIRRLEREKFVSQIIGQDVDSNLSYSIFSGPDQSLFEVNSSSGILRFLDPTDFESASDSNGDNDYNVTVRASDGEFHVDQEFIVSVANAEDPPVIDLMQPSSITATSAVLEGNLTSFTGNNQPEIILFYDENSTSNTLRIDPMVPENLTGKFSLWLDANNSNSIISSGGAVSQWNDISGNNHNFTQDNNDSKPITGSFNQNGGNVIHFDGNDTLQRPYSNILNFDQTWLMVARIDNGGVDNAGDSLLSYGYISTGSWELRANNNSNFSTKLAKGQPWLNGTLTKTVTQDAYHLFTISFDRNLRRVSNWVDGTIRTNAVSDPIDLFEKQKMTLMGNRNGNAQTLGGKVAELICMRSVLSDDRERAEGYLIHKWGISSVIDANHPYKTARPMIAQPLTQVSLGNKAVGPFSHTVTGLQASTTYEYRFQGVHALGNAFSSYGYFTTVSTGIVSTLFPINMTASSATIRADIISTGGEDVQVTFYWGDNNASNQAAGWDFNQTLSGTFGTGVQSFNATGLQSGIGYYFTAKVTNSAGSSWSPVFSFSAIANDPPSSISADGPLQIAENLPAGSIIRDFNASDPNAGAVLTYALVDNNNTTQNHLFTLDQNGTLRSTVPFDFENNASSYTVRIRVTDQYFSFLEQDVTFSLTDLNEPPLLTSFGGGTTSPAYVMENYTFVGQVTAVDEENATLSFSISGGADQSFFELNSTTGHLSFITAPDFETALDNGANNVYQVIIQASDGVNQVAQTLNVNVVNSNEPR